MRSKKVIFLCLLVILLTACSDGRGDWTYALPNDYEVFLVNSETIVITGPFHTVVQEEGSVYTNYYINNYVSAFCYNERYVGAQQINVRINQPDRPIHQPWFYLLDTITGTVIGPLESEDEFHLKCEALQITDLCDWIFSEDLSASKAKMSPFN